MSAPADGVEEIARRGGQRLQSVIYHGVVSESPQDDTLAYFCTKENNFYAIWRQRRAATPEETLVQLDSFFDRNEAIEDAVARTVTARQRRGKS